MAIKIISWNVNGIRSVLKKGFLGTVKKEKPDILCLQETRGPAEGVSVAIAGYQEFWNNAARPGYSGTVIFSKSKPLSIKNGISIAGHDQEGRVITAEYNNFFLVNVYVPNSKRDLSRLDYRTKQWDRDFLKYLKKLEKKKPVVFCGDLNVAHTEIDLANPKGNTKNHGFTPEERAGFDAFVKAGFVDAFRCFEKEGGHYTWWSRLGNCRARNIGWRIDYLLVSDALKKNLEKAWILKEVSGSDHCPVGIVLKGVL